jgi:hypothetical protein
LLLQRIRHTFQLANQAARHVVGLWISSPDSGAPGGLCGDLQSVFALSLSSFPAIPRNIFLLFEPFLGFLPIPLPRSFVLLYTDVAALPSLLVLRSFQISGSLRRRGHVFYDNRA